MSIPNIQRYPLLHRYLQQRKRWKTTPTPGQAPKFQDVETRLGSQLRGIKPTTLDMTLAVARALEPIMGHRVEAAVSHKGEDRLVHLNLSPDGASFKPFHLQNIGGRACIPARDTLMYRTLEWSGRGWPPISYPDTLNDILSVDLAVGMSKRHLRAAGALAAEPALVLDGITSIHPPPDALQIEAAFDSEAARKLSPSELSQAKAVLQDLRVPNQPHGPPGGLARLTDETVPDQVYTKWRRKLIALTQTAVPDLVAQLLIAHEACGAVHGASVVGGSLARFYVLGAGCVATDLGDPTGQTRDLSLLARPGTTLRNLLLNPILPAFLAAEPRPVCAWDVAPSPRLGPPLQLQVPLGEGLHTLAAMLEAARVRVESNGPVPARLPTILQDVMGVVKGHRMDVLFTDQNQNSNVIPTVDIIDRSVRMIPVTTHEMTKLIESAEWIPQAMYSSLDNLASTFQASPSNDTPAAHADSAATDVKTSSPRKGSISATEIAHDPEPDAWWQEKWPRPKSSHSSARTHHVETEEVADADLAAFKLGLAAGTEDELFDPDVEFFVSTGVDELAFPSISPAECPLQDTVPPAKKGATERSSFDTIRALITSTDPPQPDTDTLATVETDTDTLVAVKTDTDTLATVGTDTDTLATVGTDTDTLVTVETSRKAAPSLPPHLAALRALYDLEGDVVKTTEVTTKVDLPGMRQSASSMGFRGSSGTGPRRPGEEPPSAEK